MDMLENSCGDLFFYTYFHWIFNNLEFLHLSVEQTPSKHKQLNLDMLENSCGDPFGVCTDVQLIFTPFEFLHLSVEHKPSGPPLKY